MNRTKQIKILALFLLLLLAGNACNHDTAHSQQSNSKVEWVNTNQLKPGPIRHEKLSDLQIQRIKKIRGAFAEVDQSSFDKWMDDFRRDADPDREIAIWERMAAAYSRYISGKNLSLETKLDVFQVVLLRSTAPAEEVLNHLTLKVLTEEDAKEIMKGF
jgi:hypothetical protein